MTPWDENALVLPSLGKGQAYATWWNCGLYYLQNAET